MAAHKKKATRAKKATKKTTKKTSRSGLKDLDARGKVKGGFNPQPEPPRNRGAAPIINPGSLKPGSLNPGSVRGIST